MSIRSISHAGVQVPQHNSSPGLKPSQGSLPTFASTLDEQLAANEGRAAAASKAPPAKPETSDASFANQLKQSARGAQPDAVKQPAAKPEDSGKEGAETETPEEPGSQVSDERALDELALTNRATSAPSKNTSKVPAPSAKSTNEKAAADKSSSQAQGAPQAGATVAPANMKKSASDPARDIRAAADNDHASLASKKLSAATGKPGAEPVTSSAKPTAVASASAAATSIAPGASAVKSSSGTARAAPVAFAREAELDPSLHVSLLPQAAHMRMDLDGAGDLALHLRLRDGVAHVTVSGSAAPLVDARSSDLRTSLASQGLSLGSLEHVAPASASQDSGATGQQLSQDRSQAGDRERDDGAPSQPATSSSSSTRSSQAFTISRSTASAISGDAQ